MAENDLIMHLVDRPGQSQNQRMAAELDIHYADIDNRTREELFRYTSMLASHIHFYEKNKTDPTEKWDSFFREISGASAPGDGTTPPHRALFLAFLELYKEPQRVINTLTGRHLDFYYREVLRLSEISSQADTAHIVVELKKNMTPVELNSSHVFSAGKDGSGIELHYRPEKSTLLNHARLTSVKSVFYEKSGFGTIHYAPIADSLDGLGKPSLNGWDPLGNKSLPKAAIGFAFASPVLRMREGVRTIKILLQINNRDVLASAARAGAFDAYISGEKNWLGPYGITVSTVAADAVTFSFTVGINELAVADYQSSLHGHTFKTAAPVIQLLLKSGITAVGYNELSTLTIFSAAITVEVDGLTSLSIENDQGIVNPKKAFLPFGPQPVAGSKLLIGCQEALFKSLSELSMELHWLNAPASFHTRYEKYQGSAAINNSYFTASVAFEDGEKWHLSKTRQALFDPNNASLTSKLSFQAGEKREKPVQSVGRKLFSLKRSGNRQALQNHETAIQLLPIWEHYQMEDSDSSKGSITIRLEKSFLHSEYRKQNTEIILNKTGKVELLEEPYTPILQKVTLSYKAETGTIKISSALQDDYTDDELLFFHVGCFGQMREHGYQRNMFSFIAEKAVPLFPEYRNEGELCLGFTALNAGDSVSVLFQVSEGSGEPDLEPPAITWSVLCDNYWQPLQSSEVLFDTTGQLLTSGIITFLLPSQATTTNTILQEGVIWIKASALEHVAAMPRMSAIIANALAVTLINHENNPQHLATSLSEGLITKLITPVAAVKSVTQPYHSFGGKAEESEMAFYTRVSERLRHKNRCITAWDYERMILAAFPDIHKVNCINHASYDKNGNICRLTPGSVVIVLIPDLRNKNVFNQLQPKTDSRTIKQVTDFIREHSGMQIHVSVTNPRYQTIQLDFSVKFLPGFEFNYYSGQLKQKVKEFLSPWAFDASSDIRFGGKIYKSQLLNFIEEITCVDFIENFAMYSNRDTTHDLDEVEPAGPDTILVSDDVHRIFEVQ